MEYNEDQNEKTLNSFNAEDTSFNNETNMEGQNHNIKDSENSEYKQKTNISTTHSSVPKENKKSEDKSGKFIMGALLSSVIFVAIVAGLGWAIFYPKDNLVTIAENQPTAGDLSETEQENTLEVNESGDLVIIYGGEEEEPITSHQADIKPSPTAPVETATPSLPTPPVVSTRVETTPPKQTPTPLTNTVVSSSSNTKKQAVKTISTPPPTQPSSSDVSTSSSSSKKVFWVQIFSTNNMNKAETFKSDLEKNGIVATVVVKDINNKIFYRLRIGPYYNKEEGNKFLHWVKQTEKYKDAYLTQVYI